MKLQDCKFLTDENIQGEVVQFLISKGFDVVTVFEWKLDGQDDETVLRFAHLQGRIVLTHDSDFGTLTVAGNKPFTGIIYLKPGHIAPKYTIQSLETLIDHSEDLDLPCIIVLQHTSSSIRIRVRRM